MRSIGIQFPFQDSSEGGRFATTKTTKQAVRSNLISLMLTRRGQRPMRSNVYSPFFDYIFDPWDETTEDMLTEDVKRVVADVMPEINLVQMNFDFNENTNVLAVEFIYSIVAYSEIEDSVSLNFQFQNSNF